MKSINTDEFHESLAVSIGSVVHESLGEVQRGSVFGLSTRGIFIKTKGKWLNFLSQERFRGPLTINLAPNFGSIPEIAVGMEVEISAHNLKLPDIGWRISLHEADRWQPKPAAGSWVTKGDRLARLVIMANKIMEKNFESGLAPLLPHLIEITDGLNSSEDVQPGLYGEILHLQQEMKSLRTLPLPSTMLSLLGLGAGLTPSGDDFVLGMLLALNRWKDLNRNIPGIDQFNHLIVEAAYQKTTTLSANLIECASLGLGNERLINALDWLVNGEAEEVIPVDDLLSWGHSSGIDAFAGYVVALSNSFSGFAKDNGSLG